MYSVAIAAYNGEKFIREQLASILDQTIRPFEIIVGDDKSQDKTLETVREIAALNPEIQWKIIENASNLGFVKNFESIIRHCSQRFVFLSDQDDTWKETKAEKLLEILNGENCKVVFSNAAVTNSDLELSGTDMFRVTGFDESLKAGWNKGKAILNKLLSGNIVTGATLAFEREYVLKMFPFPQSENFIHDSWIAAISKLDNQLKYTDEKLILYRQHAENAIGIRVDETNTSIHIILREMLLDDLTCKYSRELELLQFLEKNHHFPEATKQLEFLRKRQELYQKLIHRKNNVAGRFFTLSPALFFEKMPNFNTLRAFLGNGYIYVFDRK